MINNNKNKAIVLNNHVIETQQVDSLTPLARDQEQ